MGEKRIKRRKVLKTSILFAAGAATSTHFSACATPSARLKRDSDTDSPHPVTASSSKGNKRAGTAAGSPQLAQAEGEVSETALKLGDESEVWATVRKSFDLDPEVAHLSSMLLSTHPQPVQQAIDRHRRGLNRNPATYWSENNVRLRRQARMAAAEFCGVSPQALALTENTTQGLAILYNGLKIEAGDHILSTIHDHPATRRSLKYKAAQCGASYEQVQLYRSSEVSESSLIGPLIAAIRPSTRVIALTWVHSSTGVKLPISTISAHIRDLNSRRPPSSQILLCVDGVHGFGVENQRVPDLGVDYFAAGCHKWLFGPRGTGILCAARPKLFRSVRPTIPSFGPLHTPGGLMSPGGFHAFEHRWALNEAFNFINSIGLERISRHSHQLARQFKEGLLRHRKAKLHTPMEEAFSSAIVCFEIAGYSTQTLVKRLAEQGVIISRSPYSTHYARVTPSLVNTQEDVERALNELWKL